jgi:hypothetical protein
VQRIMAQMGTTYGTTSTDERNQACQQLHDLILKEPIFFTMDDLPVNPAWKTSLAKSVFDSANKYKLLRLRPDQHRSHTRTQDNTRTTTTGTIKTTHPAENRAPQKVNPTTTRADTEKAQQGKTQVQDTPAPLTETGTKQKVSVPGKMEKPILPAKPTGAPGEGRPTRSNTKAPDIPPTSSISIERQIRKDLPK